MSPIVACKRYGVAQLDDRRLTDSFGVFDTKQVGKKPYSLISGTALTMYQAKKAGRRQAAMYSIEYAGKEEAI